MKIYLYIVKTPRAEITNVLVQNVARELGVTLSQFIEEDVARILVDKGVFTRRPDDYFRLRPAKGDRPQVIDTKLSENIHILSVEDDSEYCFIYRIMTDDEKRVEKFIDFLSKFTYVTKPT